MSESVEQAALRRAAFADLPEPWPDMLHALDSIASVNESLFGLIELIRDGHDTDIGMLHAENAELRDGLLALSNRIEAVTRERFSERTCHRYGVVHEAHIYKRGGNSFVCPGVVA